MDFGVDALELDRASMTSADIESTVADHAVDVSGARSALMARLVARWREAEGRLDRVADGARVMLDDSDDPNVQTLATYAGAVGVTAVAGLFGSDDGSEYPDSVMQGDPNAYWSTPEARAAQMRDEELDNYDGADIGWDDVGEALALIFADPRECVGDDASVGGCAFEGVTLIPLAKILKLAKLGKYAKKADDAGEEARDAERRADDAVPDNAKVGSPDEFDPSILRGLSTDDVRERIPDDWIPRPSKRGGGTIYEDPSHPGRQIRIMPGYPEGSRPDAITGGPYVVVSQNGSTTKLPLDGNSTLG